jgi:peptidoglycan hydrolase CwlO-like protein
MTNIVERLGNLIECEMDKAQCELYSTAKAEIERLRASDRALCGDVAEYEREIACKDAEIERLKAEIERLEKQIEATRWLVNIEEKLDKIIDGLRQLGVR